MPMKRAPIVLAGTAAGLIGVLSYQTSSTPSAVILSGASGTPTATGTTTARSSTTTSRASSPRRATASTGSVTTPSTTRTATGQDVSYPYGDIELKVTKTGSRITNISIVKLNDTDPRSQAIDEQAVPMLNQQAMSAQSAKIDGVSGASFTSQAYAQSLQSALDKLA